MSKPKYFITQTVRKRISKDKIGIISKEPQKRQGIYWYEITLRDQSKIKVPEESIEVFEDRASPDEYFKDKAFSDYESFTKIITYNKLIGGYQNNPTALMSSKTLFEPHQFKPLLKFLYSDSQRLLIADEVGLGKTIEAGHILLELNARNPLKTVIVICPKSLCLKWERELSEKFSFYFEIIDKKRMMKFLNDYENGNLPPQFYAIISYQSVRARNVRERLMEVNPEIDLIIFDEMHWARNQDSLTHKLTKQISEFSEAVLGLTATPIMLGNKNLYNLLSILNPFEFQDENQFYSLLNENKSITNALRELGKLNYHKAKEYLKRLENGPYSAEFSSSPLYKSVINRLDKLKPDRELTIKLLKDTTELGLLSHIVTRTRRREVELKAKRKSHTLKLEFTEFEKRFYQAVTKYVQNKYSLSMKDNRGTNFALMMPQRQVASCIPAMIERYTKELKYMNNDNIFEENSDLSDYNINQDNEFVRDSNYTTDLRQLILSLTNEQIEKTDSKFNALLNALLNIKKSNPKAKILIFTYFKATINYLSLKLKENGFNNYFISGDIGADKRQEIMDDFRNRDDIKILISTEVGSEGIDLEFCSIIVNYDLPWNPMIVEQRIGRVDRFGQKSDIITVINFAVKETIEARILERLYERIEIFKESLGDLEDILGEEIYNLTRELLSQELTPKEQEEKIEEAANVIMNRKLEAQKLEKEAVVLTNDEFFKQELEAIITEKRYITEEELQIYLNEFFRRKYKDSVIRKTENNNVYTMYLSIELENDVTNYLKKVNKNINEFSHLMSKIRLSKNRVINITFNPVYAFNNKRIEFMNAFHPIVQFTTEFYSKNAETLFPCSWVSLDSNKYLKKGIYFYFTYEFHISGGKNYKSLSYIFINKNKKEALTESSAAELIAQMLVDGKTPDYNKSFIPNELEDFINKAEDIAHDRFSKIKEEIVELNESTIKKQLNLTERIYNTKIERKEETIALIKNDTKRSRIIPALKGQIKKMINEKQLKIFEINKKKEIDEQMKLIATGILIIKG